MMRTGKDLQKKLIDAILHYKQIDAVQIPTAAQCNKFALSVSCGSARRDGVWTLTYIELAEQAPGKRPALAESYIQFRIVKHAAPSLTDLRRICDIISLDFF